jgi:hypothetical protein
MGMGRFKRWKNSLPREHRTYSDGSYIPCQLLKQRFRAETSSLVPLTPPLGTEDKKENNMNTTIQAVAAQKLYSVEQDRIEHFVSVRLPRIASEKTTELGRHFGLTDDPFPKTWKELMERIEKKQFVVNEEREALAEAQPDWYGGCPINNVRFRDPKKEPDQKGFNEAVKAMHQGMRETEDEIVAHQNDGEKILVALQKFEGKTFH